MERDHDVSRHFHLEQVADGVYAAIARSGAGVQGNAGFIDLGDRTLIFDTFLTPQAAADLRAAAEDRTGHPIAYVVNSHWHMDHVLGNQVFAPDVEIVATVSTRATMAARVGPWIERQRGQPNTALEALERRLADETDARRRSALQDQLTTQREVVAALPTLTLALPTLTFQDRLVFNGAARTVELLTYGGAHTESDAFLWLPAERIAFMADLVIIEGPAHPLLSAGDPWALDGILERVALLGPEVVIPGHGLVGTMIEVAAMSAALREYIAILEQLLDSGRARGQTVDEIASASMPATFAGWNWPEFFAPNLRAVAERANRSTS